MLEEESENGFCVQVINGKTPTGDTSKHVRDIREFLWSLPVFPYSGLSPPFSLRGVPPGTTWQSPWDFGDDRALGSLALRG
ncbi:MAG TPA: hypothetical protein PLN86_06570 [Candidatus Hydrogenedentes bacterium]|nr:hypothetical protein [Candidatus Hydrogenedentota bacterium]